MLYDYVKAEAIKEGHADLLLILNKAYIIDAQNIANYMFSDSYTDTHKAWHMRDFPNCAPPFQVMWMEFKPPRYTQGQDLGLQRPTMGVLMRAEEISSLTPAEMSMIAQATRCSELELKMALADCRWLCGAKCFDMFHEGETRFWGELLYAIKNDGTFVWILNRKVAQFSDEGKAVAERKGVDLKTLLSRLEVSMFCPMLTLSFLHCKNVRAERTAPISEALQKARVSRGKPRMTRPHIIIIEPMRKVLSAAGHSSCSPKSMHIVRGHFRTYEEKPLFGKLTGTFWVGSHVSGTAGEPVKNSYNVRV